MLLLVSTAQHSCHLAARLETQLLPSMNLSQPSRGHHLCRLRYQLDQPRRERLRQKEARASHQPCLRPVQRLELSQSRMLERAARKQAFSPLSPLPWSEKLLGLQS